MNKPLSIVLSLAVAVPIPAFAAGTVRTTGGTHAAPRVMIVPLASQGNHAMPLQAAPLSLGSVDAPASVLPGAAKPQDAVPAGVDSGVDIQSANDGQPIGAAPSAQPQSLLGRLGSALKGEIPMSRVFDASAKDQDSSSASAISSLRPMAPLNVPGLKLDKAPTSPAPQGFGTQTAAIEAAIPQTFNLVVVTEDAIERELRAVLPKDLKTVHVRKITGYKNQADTFYATFQQTQNGLEVDGGLVQVTVKIINNKPQVVEKEVRLHPTLGVSGTPKLNDTELKTKAEQKLNLPQNSGNELVFIERKITNVGGKWRAVNIYDLDGNLQGMRVAVDIATGESFAWDARHGIVAMPQPQMGAHGRAMASGAAPTAAAAQTSGSMRTTAEGKEARPNGKPELVDLPLPHMKVTIGGQVVYTDAEGKFTSPVDGDLTANLEGKWAIINDQNRKPVKIVGTVKAGQPNILVAQTTADDLLTLNQLNMYVWTSKIHDWWSTYLQGDKRIDRQVPTNVNINQDCNAYYTPGRPSTNYFRESKRCSDTGRPGIGAHEYGHFVDDMIGGSRDRGLGEGWGDIGSMFLLHSPIIGDGFLKGQNPSYIRHGENNYQYSKWDEEHDKGQAWMGFAWKLRKAVMDKVGEEGAAIVANLIVPTMLTKAQDIPGQIAKVLLNATDKDGKVMYEAEIRAAAKAHGIDIPAKGSESGGGWWPWLQSFGRSSGPKADVKVVDAKNGSVTLSVIGFGAKDMPEAIKAAFKLSPVDYRVGSSVKVEEKVSLFNTALEVTIKGTPAALQYYSKQIERLAQ